ncbi:M15 family metallopeptidase [Oceanidesulfovibrio marinus]|uniref:D-alanyl-D-alanine dipeptidase n=1 Tax=Oceanidesulfovibrio marinus TaxID=370038 RepID=A0A6P1ZND4_9BACT|nr:M15 family metallopeptidase [Oceanidesulfovibrio marinus]TVM36869.1 peptidase M15 [Oceanidesulfovibrio marinus]
MPVTGRSHDRRAVVLCCLVFLLYAASAFAAELPEGFVYLDEIAPTVAQEVRYYGEDNFVGARVDGYLAPRIIAARQVAEGLKTVQAELKPFGLGLKVFDAYRPQRAVDHFVRWARDLDDTKTKAKYYPDVPKSKLFEQDYIASRSGHSRGAAVDLTIVSLDDGAELDMGSGFDFFGPISWPDTDAINAQQRANRLLLRRLMLGHGFAPYPREWWHFSLKDEPFPDTYFDFPIQ